MAKFKSWASTKVTVLSHTQESSENVSLFRYFYKFYNIQLIVMWDARTRGTSWKEIRLPADRTCFILNKSNINMSRGGGGWVSVHHGMGNGHMGPTRRLLYRRTRTTESITFPSLSLAGGKDSENIFDFSNLDESVHGGWRSRSYQPFYLGSAEVLRFLRQRSGVEVWREFFVILHLCGVYVEDL